MQIYTHPVKAFKQITEQKKLTMGFVMNIPALLWRHTALTALEFNTRL